MACVSCSQHQLFHSTNPLLLHLSAAWTKLYHIRLQKKSKTAQNVNWKHQVSYSCINEEEFTGRGTAGKINGCDQMQVFTSSKN